MSPLPLPFAPSQLHSVCSWSVFSFTTFSAGCVNISLLPAWLTEVFSGPQHIFVEGDEHLPKTYLSRQVSAKNLDSWAPGIGSIGLGHFTQLSAVILIQGYHSLRKQCSQLCDSGVDLGTMLGLGDYLGAPLGSGPPEGRRG